MEVIANPQHPNLKYRKSLYEKMDFSNSCLRNYSCLRNSELSGNEELVGGWYG